MFVLFQFVLPIASWRVSRVKAKKAKAKCVVVFLMVEFLG